VFTLRSVRGLGRIVGAVAVVVGIAVTTILFAYSGRIAEALGNSIEVWVGLVAFVLGIIVVCTWLRWRGTA
jgi:hypothetical protein